MLEQRQACESGQVEGSGVPGRLVLIRRCAGWGMCRVGRPGPPGAPGAGNARASLPACLSTASEGPRITGVQHSPPPVTRPTRPNARPAHNHASAAAAMAQPPPASLPESSPVCRGTPGRAVAAETRYRTCATSHHPPNLARVCAPLAARPPCLRARAAATGPPAKSRPRSRPRACQLAATVASAASRVTAAPAQQVTAHTTRRASRDCLIAPSAHLTTNVQTWPGELLISRGLRACPQPA